MRFALGEPQVHLEHVRAVQVLGEPVTLPPRPARAPRGRQPAGVLAAEVVQFELLGRATA